MTEDEKKLLLKDLCGRLTSHTIIQVYYEEMSGSGTFNEELWGVEIESPVVNFRGLDYIKPYLRPMSTMTEEEKSEFANFACVNLCPMMFTDKLTLDNESKMFDWLNAHHFDYHGLIEKGLAFEAPEDMYQK